MPTYPQNGKESFWWIKEGKPHPGGRPLLFKTPEELQNKIDQYFKQKRKITKAVATKNGQVDLKIDAPATWEGLAEFLGCDVTTIRNYKLRDKFFKPISCARNRIQQDWIENGLLGIYNPKLVTSILPSSDKDYRQTVEVEPSESFEQTLAMVHEARMKGMIDVTPKKQLPDVDTVSQED